MAQRFKPLIVALRRLTVEPCGDVELCGDIEPCPVLELVIDLPFRSVENG
jgi:hypothetical protein